MTYLNTVAASKHFSEIILTTILILISEATKIVFPLLKSAKICAASCATFQMRVFFNVFVEIYLIGIHFASGFQQQEKEMEAAKSIQTSIYLLRFYL